MPSEATPNEVLRYKKAYIATSNALGDAIIILDRLQAISLDESEIQEIVLQRRQLEDEYARNERSFLAFDAREMAMHPPSQSQVDAIVELASQLALLTLQRAVLSNVLALANDVASRFADIRGTG
jgi:hypothetical protein